MKTVIAALLLVAVALPAVAAEKKKPKEKTVTIDVKDADVRLILKSMQKQCGIRNLMIDPQVQGQGTFLFKDVPCSLAFKTVLRSTGLDAMTYSNAIVAVEPRKQ